MNKDKLHKAAEADLKISRGALLEIMENNRIINANIVPSLEEGDFTSLEEYNMLVKNILDAVKTLEQINSSSSDIFTKIEKMQIKGKGIDLDKLMETE